MRVATAECFTHCQIALTLHRVSTPYSKRILPLEVVWGGFFPNVESVKSLLKIELPNPIINVNGIKVYDEEGDLKVAYLLSKRLKELFELDIAIASSAGIGKGAVVISFRNETYFLRSKYSADLRKDSFKAIMTRSYSAAKRTFKSICSLIKKEPLPPYLNRLKWIK